MFPYGSLPFFRFPFQVHFRWGCGFQMNIRFKAGGDTPVFSCLRRAQNRISRPCGRKQSQQQTQRLQWRWVYVNLPKALFLICAIPAGKREVPSDWLPKAPGSGEWSLRCQRTNPARRSQMEGAKMYLQYCRLHLQKRIKCDILRNSGDMLLLSRSSFPVISKGRIRNETENLD